MTAPADLAATAPAGLDPETRAYWLRAARFLAEPRHPGAEDPRQWSARQHGRALGIIESLLDVIALAGRRGGMSDHDDNCTLDQWITSAGAAMSFARHNWQAFCEFTEGVIGEPVPITPEQMTHHANALMALADPERMAS